MSAPRVVVTGIGLLTSNAHSVDGFTVALREGKSGVKEITRFDTGWPFRQGGEVELPPEDEDPKLDRVSELAPAASTAYGVLLLGGGVFACTERSPC